MTITVRTPAATQSLLWSLARKYVWWKAPADALKYPRHVIAQVMNLGTWNDLRTLQGSISRDLMREVVQHAEPGWFNEDAWHYWHYRLQLLPPSATVPELPRRTLE